jgi:DNA-nicking Smr family endonuclease
MKKISNSEWAKIFGVDTEEENKKEFIKAIQNIPTTITSEKETKQKILSGSLKKKLPKKIQLHIDNTVDLHLKTKEESKILLQTFINNSIKAKDKYILIIHGKGKHSKGDGVLKNYVKQLLESKFNNVIDWYGSAPKQLGGEGAVVVKIKSGKLNE